LGRDWSRINGGNDFDDTVADNDWVRVRHARFAQVEENEGNRYVQIEAVIPLKGRLYTPSNPAVLTVKNDGPRHDAGAVECEG
jgi:hypothetical protein